MSTGVDRPIINDPYIEPSKYYEFIQRIPELVEGRRPASYYLAPRTRDATGPRAAEARVELELVNRIRARVKEWREAGYPGATRTTRTLLEYWNREEHEPKLFFCQVEAAETIIWLSEAPPANKQGVLVPPDAPVDLESLSRGFKPLRRLCCKMATGSGKTVVMAMIIAWSVLNKVQNKQDTRFSDAVLAVCPNLTIRERLKVLYPSEITNYYEAFDLVPPHLLPLLSQGKFEIVNWQFLAEERDKPNSVLKLGVESPPAFSRRVLWNIGDKNNILVINDEAHHAYRPAPRELGGEQGTLNGNEALSDLKEREEEAEEATVWVNALDKIQAARGINFCLDMSATPFHIKGSGHPEGEPLPWLVSDFGLVDAIESGIVKIPRIPFDDNSQRPEPKYFRLWQAIMEKLPANEREGTHRKAKPESVMREAEGALETLASQWEKTFLDFRDKGSGVPPVMIVVCANTDLAKLVYEHIASGRAMPELENQEGKINTLRIDSRLLEEAEKQTEVTGEETPEERLRTMVATVGKIGEPGEQLRCVVSVAMLNEGWDAQNVTQILGLRAFSSQLLCEQVVGRGLRRTNYRDIRFPEYVDVYGIPFEVIPVQKGSLKASLPVNPPALVRSLPERKQFEMRFPRVEGYVFDVKYKIRADVQSIPPIYIDPTREPTEVAVKAAEVVKIGRPDRSGPGNEIYHDRNPFHKVHRLQTSVYEIAAEVTEKIGKPASRHLLFPQVKEIVWRYMEEGVSTKEGAVLEDVALLKYRDLIVSRLCDAIRPDTEAGETAILPLIERHRSTGSTSEVMFRTVKDCYPTTKSHISHVVLDSQLERSFASEFERNPHVVSYVKNDHLDFTIPYEFEGSSHSYYPDYLVDVLTKDSHLIHLIIEAKGVESEKDRAKIAAAQRWTDAVNHQRGYGLWKYIQCTSSNLASEMINKMNRSELSESEKSYADRALPNAIR